MGASELRVVVIGAGIGGLSLGLALRERGVAADVFEQAPALTEIGAAIALSANATREYARLGLVDELAAAATIPTELIYRDWRTGDRVAAHPVAKDDWYVQRFGAPYFGIHRADLQKTLGTAFGMQNLHLGCRLVDLVEQRDGVVLEFANGRVERADLVVGADGVRSTVRRWVTGADDTIYSGTSAFRGIVPVDRPAADSRPNPLATPATRGPAPSTGTAGRTDATLPPRSGTGRRIVYCNSCQRAWHVTEDGDWYTFQVSGKVGVPSPGVYHVIRKLSPGGSGDLILPYFVGFAYGSSTDIGFHGIPLRPDGSPIQSDAELGQFRSHGCVRESQADAVRTWNFGSVGTPVIVTP